MTGALWDKLHDLEDRLVDLAKALRDRLRSVESRVDTLDTHREHDIDAVRALERTVNRLHLAAWTLVAELGTGLAIWAWSVIMGGG